MVNFNRLGAEFLLDESKTEFSKNFASSTMNSVYKKKKKTKKTIVKKPFIDF